MAQGADSIFTCYYLSIAVISTGSVAYQLVAKSMTLYCAVIGVGIAGLFAWLYEHIDDDFQQEQEGEKERKLQVARMNSRNRKSAVHLSSSALTDELQYEQITRAASDAMIAASALVT